LRINVLREFESRPLRQNVTMPHQHKHKKLLPELVMWEAPEFEQYQRTQAWYVIAGLIAFGLIGFAIYSRSLMTLITFALIIILGVSAVFRRPKKLIHRITSLDISVGQIIYPYKNVKKFWIIYQPPEVKTLNLETTAYLNSLVTLQLGDQDPVEVKVMLQKYLPEDLDREESLNEILARRAKF
jgi:hypothetical protein